MRGAGLTIADTGAEPRCDHTHPTQGHPHRAPQASRGRRKVRAREGKVSSVWVSHLTQQEDYDDKREHTERRAGGFTRVEAPYDGYGDSGNVGEIAIAPEGVDIDDLNARLQDFIWGMAYDLHPGFETNDGAEGTVTWDVTADRIDIDHASFYTDRHDYNHEDV